MVSRSSGIPSEICFAFGSSGGSKNNQFTTTQKGTCIANPDGCISKHSTQMTHPNMVFIYRTESLSQAIHQCRTGLTSWCFGGYPYKILQMFHSSHLTNGKLKARTRISKNSDWRGELLKFPQTLSSPAVKPTTYDADFQTFKQKSSLNFMFPNM